MGYGDLTLNAIFFSCRLLGTIGIKVTSQAHLPDDKDQSIVWDEKTKVCGKIAPNFLLALALPTFVAVTVGVVL